jgi:hypothetical protein
MNCVEFKVLTAVVMKSSIFWDIKLCSPLIVNRCYGEICRLHLQGRIISQAAFATFFVVSYLAYSSTLTMEAICSSETPAGFQWTTRSYIPEHRAFHGNETSGSVTRW